MWDQQMISIMFPNNRLPSEPWKKADSLINSQYDSVSIREQKMARNMVVEERELTWYKDGSFENHIIYDVYPFPSIEETPCLSVYGGKMVQNWLQLKQYHQPKEEEEKKENEVNAGFNYTGL